MNKKPKIIIIIGPTASGKSDLAVKIALRLRSGQAKKIGINGAEIISADSRQVYKGFDIGAGKVPRDPISNKTQKSEIQIYKQPYFYKGIRHHLLDVASPKHVFTIAQYQKLGKKAIKDIIKRGKIPIICGGTGFYIDSLIYNYKLPEVKPNKKLRAKLEKKSAEELFKQLKKLDPQRAGNIDRHNRRRLIRALEIVLITKRPVPFLISVNQGNNQRKSATAYAVLKIGIKKSPEELKKLIYKRLMKRLKIGIVEEVKKLRKSGLSWKRLDDLGLEYRYISRYLRGLITRQEMIDLILKESVKYAKRQMTWFKRDKNIHWINPKKERAATERLVKNFLTQKAILK